MSPEYDPPSSDLPEGLTLDDLRFVDPELYSIHMASLGWTAAVETDVDGNPAKLGISLDRTVDQDFDEAELRRLYEAIGLFDESGRVKDGYNLALRREEHYGEETLRAIRFTFRGFPTEDTMEVLAAMEAVFIPPPRFEKIKRLFGKLLGNH